MSNFNGRVRPGHLALAAGMALLCFAGPINPASARAAQRAHTRPHGSFRLTLFKRFTRTLEPAWSPDGRQLAGVTKDGINLWNTRTWRLVRVLENSQDASALSFSLNGKRLLALCWSNDAKAPTELWNTRTGKLLQSLPIHTDGFVVSKVSWGAKVAAYSVNTGTIYQCDLSKGGTWGPLAEHGAGLITMAFSPGGKLLLIGDNSPVEGHGMKLWSTTTGKLLRTFPTQKEDLTEVAFSPDTRLVASGSGNNTTRVWNRKTGALLWTFFSEQSPWNPARTIAFSPDGRTLASGSWNGVVTLWDLRTGRLKQTIPGHRGLVSFVRWSPSGDILAIGVAATIELWRMR